MTMSECRWSFGFDLKFLTATSIPSSIRPMMSLRYSTLIRHSYLEEIPVSSWVPAGMKAGVTAARRALNRPLKSVKYLEAFSSSTLDLTPSFPECDHIEYEVASFGTVHKQFAGIVDDFTHLFIVPFGYLVCNEQCLVVVVCFVDAVSGYRCIGLFDLFLAS